MAKSEYSKNLRAKVICLRIIDYLLLFFPIIFYFIVALIGDGVIVKKITLISTFVIALILTLFNIIAKRHLRSVIWIMIIGIYICVDNILPLILFIAVASILDEFLFSPLINRYHTKYLASISYDEREEAKA